MQIDMRQTFPDLDSDVDSALIQDIEQSTGKSRGALTLRKVAIRSLLSMHQDEQNLPEDDKLGRWLLASKIKKGDDPIELTLDEATLIKKLISKTWGPAVYGPSAQMLEGK